MASLGLPQFENIRSGVCYLRKGLSVGGWYHNLKTIANERGTLLNLCLPVPQSENNLSRVYCPHMANLGLPQFENYRSRVCTSKPTPVVPQ